MGILCDAAEMSYGGATLSLQAHANHGTWSIDFEYYYHIIGKINNFIALKLFLILGAPILFS